MYRIHFLDLLANLAKNLFEESCYITPNIPTRRESLSPLIPIPCVSILTCLSIPCLSPLTDLTQSGRESVVSQSWLSPGTDGTCRSADSNIVHRDEVWDGLAPGVI